MTYNFPIVAPRKNNQRTLFVTIRLSAVELRGLERAAESYKQPLRVWAREILLRAATKNKIMRQFR